MGRVIDFPRRTRAFGTDYKFTGQTQKAEPIARIDPLVLEVSETLRAADPLLAPNSAALLNFYDAARGKYIGAHSDDERALVKDSPVISLSWCSQGHHRRFRFTARKGITDALLPSWGAAPGVLLLRDGCLVVMGGQCQRTHRHELMKPTKTTGESKGQRINLTLRSFEQQAAGRSSESGRAPLLAKRKRESGPH